MLKAWTNVYIINQSVLDSIVSFFLLLVVNIPRQWVGLSGALGEAYCRVWLTDALLWGSLVASTYNLVAMSVERYLAIVHAIWHKTSMTKGRVAVSLVLVWIVWPIYNSIFHFPTTGLVGGVCKLYFFWPNEVMQRTFGVIIIVFSFFLPIGALVFCYTAMARALRSKVAPGDA